MRITACLAAILMVWLIAAPAHAQSNTTPADDEFAASHLQAAQRLVDLTQSDDRFDEILPRIAEQTQSVFTRTNPALTREIEDTVMEVALELAGQRVELARTIQLIWARRFTEAEINQLIDFFSSDLGRKFTENTPVITALSIGAARQWEQELSQEMVTITRQRLREKGYSL
jgi:hypothetical protein